MPKQAYVVGTCDTKGEELAYVKRLLETAGVPAVLVDVSTSANAANTRADISRSEVLAADASAANCPASEERGEAIAAMATALSHFLPSRSDLGGVIGLGGSGAAALVSPAMQLLPIGIPKVLVSTLASGDVSAYVGASDIHMVHAVADIAGLNRISSLVLGNAAHALAGMIRNSVDVPPTAKPAIALTMFGVTTPCVRSVTAALDGGYDCIVFHATGTGGRAMEKLVESGLMAGVIDVSTTEVADLLAGGLFSAGEDRLGAIARTGIPYVGSCGALDMVNFRGLETVPERYRDRKLHRHNPQITLMRTTLDENARMGVWIGDKLNACEGLVRFLIPEGGVSALDQPGQAFHDPEADAALFDALERKIRQTAKRRLIRLPFHINDPVFARALVDNFLEVVAENAESKEI